jgi:pimeloyl-ACP methyl ester carboxylesterase
VVGHDWGGVIGWHAATAYPDRVKAYVTVAGPHPARYFELMFTNLRQFFMSWYTIYFQIPFIPELTTSALNGLIFKWIMQRTTVKKEALTQKDLTEYQQSWTYARLSAGINYYRQLARRPFWTLDFYKKHKAECPVCVVWADKDFALSLAQTAGLKRFCQKEPEIHIISDCGHWIPMEASKELHDIIIDFLNRNP